MAVSFKINTGNAHTMVAGLNGVLDGIEVTAEQTRLLNAFARRLLGITSSLEDLPALAPVDVAHNLADVGARRVFVQMCVVLAMARHPASSSLLEKIAAYASELNVGKPELTTIQEMANRTASEATAYFVRMYHNEYLDQMSETTLLKALQSPKSFIQNPWDQVERFDELPEGTLGWAYMEFHRRNGFTPPNRDTVVPAYYVNHDMCHVIAGYEATGPGEIALGAFKVAMLPDDTNMIANLINLLIHEVNVMEHGAMDHFVPSGTVAYTDTKGRIASLAQPGAADLLAEAFVRGAACSADFSRADHVAMAHLPLAEIRARYHVIPLEHPMIDEPGLWPHYV